VSESRRGWIAPHGEFIESHPTPAVRTRGLELGGHEQAALSWLQSINGDQAMKSKLLEELWDYAAGEAERLDIDFNDWTDLDGQDVIKRFFVSRGFKRVTPDEH
jgi:hypothetical protein